MSAKKNSNTIMTILFHSEITQWQTLRDICRSIQKIDPSQNYSSILKVIKQCIRDKIIYRSGKRYILIRPKYQHLKPALIPTQVLNKLVILDMLKKNKSNQGVTLADIFTKVKEKNEGIDFGSVINTIQDGMDKRYIEESNMKYKLKKMNRIIGVLLSAIIKKKDGVTLMELFEEALKTDSSLELSTVLKEIRLGIKEKCIQVCNEKYNLIDLQGIVTEEDKANPNDTILKIGILDSLRQLNENGPATLMDIYKLAKALNEKVTYTLILETIRQGMAEEYIEEYNMRYQLTSKNLKKKSKEIEYLMVRMENVKEEEDRIKNFGKDDIDFSMYEVPRPFITF